MTKWILLAVAVLLLADRKRPLTVDVNLDQPIGRRNADGSWSYFRDSSSSGVSGPLQEDGSF